MRDRRVDGHVGLWPRIAADRPVAAASVIGGLIGMIAGPLGRLKYGHAGNA